ncbi:MAG TPA: hypothetical protein VNA04_14905 [Thermoanaerobaculia bacterium]|nr:hypothetical protein [Thermoanaerobaculia bacterium]
MNEEPVDLRSLRTPPPLDDHDYAAVRARVMSKLRHRRKSGWLLPLSVAAATLLVFLFIRREPPVRPAAGPPVSPGPAAAAPPTSSAGDPARRAAVEASPIIEPPPRQAAEVRSRPPQTASQRPLPAAPAEPMLIHIQTADPEVRIIWIVKEKS